MAIFSFDAEVDGLYGPALAIAVTVRDGSREIDRFLGRVPADLAHDSWAQANILLAIENMAVTHQDSTALEEAFWEFWLTWAAQGVVPIAHCAHPVESGLFRRCVERDLAVRTFQGPYPAIHDVATALFLAGHDPSTVDGYLSGHCGGTLWLDADGNRQFPGYSGSGPAVPSSLIAVHHPLYDAIAAAIVWEHLVPTGIH